MNWTLIVDWLTLHGWKILLIIAIAAAIYFLLRHILPPIFRRTISVRMQVYPEEEVQQRTATLSRISVNTSLVVIIIIALFTILDEVGIPIAAALAGFGIAGIAIGFGAQSLVRDMISGLLILLENQYSVGDVVKIADVMGGVEEITLRRTVLRDLDGAVHSIPNGEIRVASNYTKEWSRANMMVSVAYKEDLERVMGIMRNVWKGMKNDPQWGEFILKEEPMIVRVDEFGDSGISIRLTGETKPIKQWDVMGEIRRRLKRIFDEKGIEIPWPHTKVYFGNTLEQRTREAERVGRVSSPTGKAPREQHREASRGSGPANSAKDGRDH